MSATARQGPCSGVNKPFSMDGLRRQSGLTYRRLAALTGLSTGQVFRGIRDPENAHRGDVRKLRQAMADAIRRRRSSDPNFLRHIQEKAVPFLEARQCRRLD